MPPKVQKNAETEILRHQKCKEMPKLKCYTTKVLRSADVYENFILSTLYISRPFQLIVRVLKIQAGQYRGQHLSFQTRISWPGLFDLVDYLKSQVYVFSLPGKWWSLL